MGAIKWGWLWAGLCVTATAAMHGLMGESLFKLLSPHFGLYSLVSLALTAFLILAAAFWFKDHIEHIWQKWRGKAPGDPPHRHALGPLLFALALFAGMAMAQGLLALSAAHIAADWAHHAYGLTLVIGMVLFPVFITGLWTMRDRLFNVSAHVKEVDDKGWAFHAALVGLSTPSRGSDADYALDEEAFADAHKLFEATLQDAGWLAALEALQAQRAFGPVGFWNFQMPIRLFAKMARSPAVKGIPRVMAFLPTPQSDKRWSNAEKLLTRMAATLPAEVGPKIEIKHVSDLQSVRGKYPLAEQLWFDGKNFDAAFQLVRDLILAVERECGVPSKYLAVDITSGNKEMSIIGAVATIDSHVAFTYVDTNDLRIRRFDAHAQAVGMSE